MTITAAQLKRLFPTARADMVEAIVANWPKAEAAGITTPQRIALFFANVGHETGGLRSLVESLNYTTAARIRKTWPSRFKSDAVAQPFVRQPQKLANKVYNGRMGNKAGSNDGWTFRGSGAMQTTGREGFRALGFEENPEGLRQPVPAFLSAVAEWSKRGCNAMADRGDVEACRRAINGGVIGLAEVKALYAKALPIFGVEGALKLDANSLVAATPSRDLITKVQQLLRDRGYPEVGNVDGKMGARTRNAILAFQADNEIDLTGAVSDALLAELVKAPQRPIAPERAEATAKDLKDAPSVKQGQALKTGGLIAAGTSLVGGIANGTYDVQDVIGHISTARAVWMALGAAAPWLVGAALGCVGIYFGARFVREQVMAFREGRHV